MDGDLQHDPKYIPKMFDKYLKNNLDLVVGARKLYKPNNPGLSETRRFASLILIYFFSFLNIKTKDPMSGFFLFKKKIFTKNKKRYFGKGFKILADLIINSKPRLKTEDVYIDFKRRYQNKSKMNYKILLILINFYLIKFMEKTIYLLSFLAISSIISSLFFNHSLDFFEIEFLTYFFASNKFENFLTGFLNSLFKSVEPILSKILFISYSDNCSFNKLNCLSISF